MTIARVRPSSTERELLPIWVVYRHPRDYPDKFVVRRHWIGSGQTLADIAPWSITNALAEARSTVPQRAFRIHRHPHDDPAICETWL